MKVNFWKFLAVIIVLAGVLLGSVLISLTTGEMNIGLGKAFRLVLGTGDPAAIEYMLVNQVRLPRIILGFAVGGALSLSGTILQGIYRNPLVEPYTLGISGGASLGVAVAIVLKLHLGWGEYVLPLSGFLGAFFIIFLVYTLGTGGGAVNVTRMLLIGVMISFVASSAMMLLMSMSNAGDLHGIVFWTMGSLDEPNDALIRLNLIVALTGLVVSYLFAGPLNALRLGEEKALHLGVDTNSSVRILFLMASLLAGVSVAVAGVIGFVGLIVPHVLRLTLGTDYRILLAGSFLLGGSFLILSDVVARTILSPHDLPIGVITGIIGGTVFIAMMSRKK